MKIKTKMQSSDGVARIETGGEIKEVQINEDFLHPGDESISVCWRGKSTSGIIDFKPEEVEKLYHTLKRRTHLMKGFKVFKGESPI